MIDPAGPVCRILVPKSRSGKLPWLVTFSTAANRRSGHGGSSLPIRSLSRRVSVDTRWRPILARAGTRPHSSIRCCWWDSCNLSLGFRLRSRLHVEYQPVRPPTWPSKHEGIHATSSDYLRCCNLQEDGGIHPERDFGDRSASSSRPARENRRDQFRRISESRTQGSLAGRRRPAAPSPCQCLSPGRSCSRNNP